MVNKEFRPTPKGIALVELVKAGIIKEDENGCINTKAFESFWCSFEKKLKEREKAMLEEQRCQSTEDASDNRHRVIMTFVVPALSSALGYLVCLLAH